MPLAQVAGPYEQGHLVCNRLQGARLKGLSVRRIADRVPWGYTVAPRSKISSPRRADTGAMAEHHQTAVLTRRQVMTSALKALWNDEQGQGLTEYALLIALVSLGLILLLGSYRNAIGNVFRNAATVLNGNSTPIQATP
jgi:pilus assembly protein Flp/PilA